MITIDLGLGELNLMVKDDEINKRSGQWKAPETRYARGVLAKYAKLVSSSSCGAVTS